MDRVSSGDFAASRARWLGEIAEALERASELVRELGGTERRSETAELYARIEAARLETGALRANRRSGGRHDGPEWSKDLPWRRSA